MTGRIVNLGSLCIDRVFTVDHVARGGETIVAHSVQVFAGGKGLNQSLAARRAGSAVVHVGCVGADGEFLRDVLAQHGVDIDHVRTDPATPSGNAVIQVTPQGDNAIVIIGGANRVLSSEDIERALNLVGVGDWLLLQNEINDLDQVLQRAAALQLRVCLNCAPFDARAMNYPLDGVTLLVVNEIEAQGMTAQAKPSDALHALHARLPNATIVLTLGEHGLLYATGDAIASLPAFVIETVDGTGAGDAFIGFLLAGLLQQLPLTEALVRASAAGAIAASRHGAAPAIPSAEEVTAFQAQRLAGR